MSVEAELLFVVSAIVALVCAVATIVARRPLRAAMGLLGHIIALVGVFLSLQAHMLAAIQLLVYAGAVVVLFVFVIMLIGPSAEIEPTEKGRGARTLGAALMGSIMLFIAFVVRSHQPEIGRVRMCDAGDEECMQFGGLEAMGQAIYSTEGAMVPFELVSITLLVAIIGALAMARGRTQAEADASAASEKSAVGGN